MKFNKLVMIQERVGSVEDRDDDLEFKEFRSIVNEILEMFLSKAYKIYPLRNKKNNKKILISDTTIPLDISKSKYIKTKYPDLFESKSSILNIKIKIYHTLTGPDLIDYVSSLKFNGKTNELIKLYDTLKIENLGSFYTLETDYETRDKKYWIEIPIFSGSNLESSDNMKEFILKGKGIDRSSILDTLKEEIHHYIQNILNLKTKRKYSFNNRQEYMAHPNEISPKLHKLISDLEDKFKLHDIEDSHIYFEYGRHSYGSDYLYELIDKMFDVFRGIMDSYDGIDISRIPFNKTIEIFRLVYQEVIEPTIYNLILLGKEKIEEDIEYHLEEEYGESSYEVRELKSVLDSLEHLESNLSFDFLKQESLFLQRLISPI